MPPQNGLFTQDINRHRSVLMYLQSIQTLQLPFFPPFLHWVPEDKGASRMCSIELEPQFLLLRKRTLRMPVLVIVEPSKWLCLKPLLLRYHSGFLRRISTPPPLSPSAYSSHFSALASLSAIFSKETDGPTNPSPPFLWYCLLRLFDCSQFSFNVPLNHGFNCTWPWFDTGVVFWIGNVADNQ